MENMGSKCGLQRNKRHSELEGCDSDSKKELGGLHSSRILQFLHLYRFTEQHSVQCTKERGARALRQIYGVGEKGK